MNWFYANAGQQVGPINDADFQRLVREGVIQPSTLVWREGMANWEPCSNVVPASAPPPPVIPGAPGGSIATSVPPGQVLCQECGKLVPAEDAMQLNGATICAACKPVYLQKMREGTARGPIVPGAMRYGGFWLRFVAKFIDGIIVGIPLGIIYLIGAFGFGFGIYTQQGGPPDFGRLLTSLGLQLGVQFISLVLNGIYTVFFLVKYSATPGKMAVGLRVTMSNGEPLTVGRAIGRFFAEMLSGLVCYIGYIIAAFDDQKRALHDHLCNTRVVFK
jgi:uncharacterized RDD family membrane protein YckC